jgi:hypothetical protein
MLFTMSFGGIRFVFTTKDKKEFIFQEVQVFNESFNFLDVGGTPMCLSTFRGKEPIDILRSIFLGKNREVKRVTFMNFITNRVLILEMIVTKDGVGLIRHINII